MRNSNGSGVIVEMEIESSVIDFLVFRIFFVEGDVGGIKVFVDRVMFLELC